MAVAIGLSRWVVDRLLRETRRVERSLSLSKDCTPDFSRNCWFMSSRSGPSEKADLTLRVAAGKQKLVDLEDEILRLLSEAEGSLLENETLVDTLQQSK